MTWLSVAASVGMAVGPPLVYADQAVSIIRKKYVHRDPQHSILLQNTFSHQSLIHDVVGIVLNSFLSTIQGLDGFFARCLRCIVRLLAILCLRERRSCCSLLLALHVKTCGEHHSLFLLAWEQLRVRVAGPVVAHDTGPGASNEFLHSLRVV